LNLPTAITASAAGLARARLTAAGSFEGYASLFGAEDQGRDVVMPGAFRASLARAGAASIRMLFQHDPAQPIGAWDIIREDARGLYVRGRLTLGVARAGEILALMREGALNGLSIGFRARKAVRDARSGLRRLYEIDLWEISIVTFPMLPDARISAVKAAYPSARPQDALASPGTSSPLRGSPGSTPTAHPPARREARPGGGCLSAAACRDQHNHHRMRMT
jgi:HK97 family phage prohead protease